MTLAKIKQLIACLDLTSLHEEDTITSIDTLCQNACINQEHVAAVCIYPQFVSHAWQQLMHSKINIATVVNFPHGKSPLSEVIATIQQAILDGVHEVDVVIPYHHYASHQRNEVIDFILHCKFTCGEKVLLKAILETGALTAEQIRFASEDAIAGGADFLKTSTGKIAIGATPEAANIMLSVIKKSHKPIGFKVSGGIRTIDQACLYRDLVKEYLGDDAVQPTRFRIGASSLRDQLVEKLYE